jgi:peptide deformylase
MTALKILHYPHKGLRTALPHIRAFDEALTQTIAQMFDALYAANGWGLAANQVGISSRLFVMDISPDQNQPECFINPEIVEKHGQVESEEDCLSFPGLFIKIPRARQIQLQYQDKNANQVSQTFEGLLACVIQHEVDHLNGVLFIDHLSNLKRTRLMKKYDPSKMAQACGHGCGHDHH